MKFLNVIDFLKKILDCNLFLKDKNDEFKQAINILEKYEKPKPLEVAIRRFTQKAEEKGFVMYYENDLGVSPIFSIFSDYISPQDLNLNLDFSKYVYGQIEEYRPGFGSGKGKMEVFPDPETAIMKYEFDLDAGILQKSESEEIRVTAFVYKRAWYFLWIKIDDYHMKIYADEWSRIENFANGVYYITLG
jgi:hypothetical protein